MIGQLMNNKLERIWKEVGHGQIYGTILAFVWRE
jgi:hypothetical protein